MQQYSLVNQSDAIAMYAARNGYTIVRSYEDGAKSGLRIEGRPALANLIKDIISGGADFKIVLVYDVSRWGRFQDSDESAYHEFICKQAGVSIEYCAEQFKNDGSLMSTVVKNIKRAMAGEYSRELSVKVHVGQSRIVGMGYYVGGAPGFGLRRALVDQHGNRKLQMNAGQRKSLHTEHTILVPGPPEEIETIHRVYDLFLEKRNTLNEIARMLNSKRIPNAIGRPWSWHSVRELLSNEKYTGSSVYNRTSKKLGINWRRNSRSDWTIKPRAFEAIVAPDRFRKAQQRLKENASRYTDNEMLDFLTATWCREQHLSRDIIDASIGPSTNTIKQRFGGLLAAFNRIGFSSALLLNRQRLRNLRKSVCGNIVEHIGKAGGTVEFRPGNNYQLRINQELNVTVVVGRTAASSSRNHNQWRFGYRSRHKPDLLVVARVDRQRYVAKDYFILPFIYLPPGTWLTVSGINYSRLEQFRSDSLAPLYDLCARQPLT